MGKVESIKELLSATENVYSLVPKLDFRNLTEKQLKRYVLSEYRKELGSFSFKGDILSGERSAVGEGDATERIIKRGDAIILDLLPKKFGVCADVTRTFFFGEPSEEQRTVYETVKNALLTTEKLLGKKVVVGDIYRQMRVCLKPYERTFFHHAGHRTGTRRLMKPQFLPDELKMLKVGDIVTLEPGVYIKDKFGVRLENDYVITENGCEKLFDYPLDIEKFIIA